MVHDVAPILDLTTQFAVLFVVQVPAVSIPWINSYMIAQYTAIFSSTLAAMSNTCFLRRCSASRSARRFCMSAELDSVWRFASCKRASSSSSYMHGYLQSWVKHTLAISAASVRLCSSNASNCSCLSLTRVASSTTCGSCLSASSCCVHDKLANYGHTIPVERICWLHLHPIGW